MSDRKEKDRRQILGEELSALPTAEAVAQRLVPLLRLTLQKRHDIAETFYCGADYLAKENAAIERLRILCDGFRRVASDIAYEARAAEALVVHHRQNDVAALLKHVSEQHAPQRRPTFRQVERQSRREQEPPEISYMRMVEETLDGAELVYAAKAILKSCDDRENVVEYIQRLAIKKLKQSQLGFSIQLWILLLKADNSLVEVFRSYLRTCNERPKIIEKMRAGVRQADFDV